MGKLKPPKEILIDNVVIEQIKKHSKRFCIDNNKENWVEVMGIFIGKSKKDIAYIYRAIPMTHGTSTDFQFSRDEYVLYAQIDEALLDSKFTIMGWYHTHPARRVFFSQEDVVNQLSYQTGNPHAVALVYDPEQDTPPTNLGFDVYQLDDPDQGQFSNYHSVSFKVLDIKEKEKKELFEKFYFKEEIINELFAMSKLKDSVSIKELEEIFYLSNQELEDIINKAMKLNEFHNYKLKNEVIYLK
ncbi:MAG: hypothetical protein EAX96_16205 [Candidatus Lokiarchaeota archaeon]|nr:hypothetical protein [Candidatus Lokiarchaeota archaeon]